MRGSSHLDAVSAENALQVGPQEFRVNAHVDVPIFRTGMARCRDHQANGLGSGGGQAAAATGGAAALAGIVSSTGASNEPGPSAPGSTARHAVDAGLAGVQGSATGRRYAWADLMRRVFGFEVLEGSQCGGRLRMLAAIHPPDTTRVILECLGLPSRAPPLASARIEPTPAGW